MYNDDWNIILKTTYTYNDDWNIILKTVYISCMYMYNDDWNIKLKSATILLKQKVDCHFLVEEESHLT